MLGLFHLEKSFRRVGVVRLLMVRMRMERLRMKDLGIVERGIVGIVGRGRGIENVESRGRMGNGLLYIQLATLVAVLSMQTKNLKAAYHHHQQNQQKQDEQ